MLRKRLPISECFPPPTANGHETIVFGFRTESGMPDHEIRKAFDLGGQLHYRYIGHRRGDLSQPAGDGEDHIAASDSEDCRYKERDTKHGTSSQAPFRQRPVDRRLLTFPGLDDGMREVEIFF